MSLLLKDGPLFMDYIREENVFTNYRSETNRQLIYKIYIGK